MIYFCEINKTHDEHITINGRLLQLLVAAFPAHEICCYMSPSHWNQLPGAITKDANIRFLKTAVVDTRKVNKIKWIIKICWECLTIVKIIRKATKQGARLVFFSSISPFANYFTHLLLTYFVSIDIKMIITLHGELQLLKSYHLKTVDKVYAGCIRKALRMKLANRKFLVLSELIKRSLDADGVADPLSIFEIPHPYDERYIMQQERNRSDFNHTCFGHIGTAKLAKNSHLFFDLAARNASSVTSGQVVFLISGQVFHEMVPFQNRYVEFQQSSSFVETTNYVEQCLMMDYAVFMYTDSQYGMVSSGAIMDAIAFGIPMIALKNSFLTYLFDLCHSKPGILCEDYEDMIDQVQRLINDGDENYAQYLAGINELRKYFSFKRIQRKFDDQVLRFCN